MTVTRIPLPLDPLPNMAPCSGLWELFDSRRREDHWKARRICEGCPLKAECKPPERIVTPAFPGTMGRPQQGTAAYADGTWGGRLYHSGELVDSSLDLAKVEACPRCGATALSPCRTKTGKATVDHKDRHTPRMCARCGTAPSIRRGLYCQPCRAANDQDAKNDYTRRMRSKEAA